MKRVVKGNYGYLAAKTKQMIFRTILLFGISLAIFIMGYVTTKTKQNLLTIVAVLGCLPACKSAVSLIMYLRAKGCSSEAKDAIAPQEGRLIGMYDMYFTSYQKNFAVSHMVVENKIILGYTADEKCDKKACEEHLQTMLKQSGYKDIVVSISDELQKYCEQLRNLNEKEQEGDAQRDDEARVVLYDISL